uniref:acyl-CoA hydrolase n=1 Tax=Brassica campestris TaxID=3711 RepID=M4EWQ5_BRACM
MRGEAEAPIVLPSPFKFPGGGGFVSSASPAKSPGGGGSHSSASPDRAPRGEGVLYLSSSASGSFVCSPCWKKGFCIKMVMFYAPVMLLCLKSVCGGHGLRFVMVRHAPGVAGETRLCSDVGSSGGGDVADSVLEVGRIASRCRLGWLGNGFGPKRHLAICSDSAMNTESVVEFLGNVPLLQKLPSSSLKKIAQVVVLKRYARGEYVIREEQAWDGCYFIFSGEAQVSGPEEEENRSEFLLKQYDYFGHGISAHVHSADIIATSEQLTCLVLPRDHCRLLETNSIWQSDQEVDKCSLVERILHLDPLELNIFRGITLPDAPIFGKVFGGQFMGQALAAASKTVDFRKIVHSFHSYFLLVGDIDIPIIYQVHRIRDGNNFATRRVDAIQKGNIIFILMASFQKEQQGFDHQESTMPSAPDPDTLLSLEELRERRITDPQLPRSYRNKVATANFIPWPIEIRFCEPSNSTNQTKSPPRLRYWFRAKGKLSDDQALHRCVVAFASDLIFASISLNPHRRKGLRSAALSLDHAMWFHRPLRADDWLLFVIVSPTAHMTRGFVTGEMFNRKGELVVSLTQEALLREARPPKPSVTSKL